MIGNGSAKGFTLIEVLLAMTLLSVMMALLFGSLKICAESWDRGEAKIAEDGEIAAVVNFFQRHLTGSKPLWNDFNIDNRQFSFQGGNQSLQFVSSFPASAGRAGVQLITVALDQQGSEQVLQVTLKPFFQAADGEEWLEEKEVLIGKVSRFSLSYYGSEDGLSEGRWLDDWQDKDRLPKLVKINIGLRDARYFPEMMINLKMAGTDTASLLNDGLGEASLDENPAEETPDPDDGGDLQGGDE